MKKKIKKLIHKYISIPKYEKELREKDSEIAELKRDKKYLQDEMYRYKNKVGAMRRKEAKKNDLSYRK